MRGPDPVKPDPSSGASRDARTASSVDAPSSVNAAASPGAGPPVAAPRPRRRWWRRRTVLASAAAVVVALAAALALAWLLRARILTGVARFLTVSDPPHRADAIFVFGGDPDVRPFAAAELYRRGWAPRVLVPRMETPRTAAIGLTQTQTELFVQVLRHEGVPDSAITVLELPGGSGSTRQDVQELRGYLLRTHARRILAITTNYHTRRARWTVRHGLKGVPATVWIHGVPAAGFDETNWWRSESGLVIYFNEYLKFARYLWEG